MTWFVIGASGWIGGHVLRAAALAGQAVVGTSRRPGHDSMLSFDLETTSLDGLQAGGVRVAPGDHVILCAAASQVDRCAADLEHSRRVNVERTRAVIDESLGLGAIPVFLSTSYVFDGERGAYREEDVARPICEYGRQKRAIEEHLARSGRPSLVLRLGKAVGASSREGNLFAQWSRAIAAGAAIRCLAGQQLSPTSVDDLARAIVVACARGLEGLFHVASPERCSRLELARRFVSAADIATPIVEVSQEQLGLLEPRPLKTDLRVERFLAATGFEFTPLDHVIATALREWGVGNGE